jgi:hypothetical protein
MPPRRAPQAAPPQAANPVDLAAKCDPKDFNSCLFCEEEIDRDGGEYVVNECSICGNYPVHKEYAPARVIAFAKYFLLCRESPHDVLQLFLYGGGLGGVLDPIPVRAFNSGNVVPTIYVYQVGTTNCK